jgi:hypothetical protein
MKNLLALAIVVLVAGTGLPALAWADHNAAADQSEDNTSTGPPVSGESPKGNALKDDGLKINPNDGTAEVTGRVLDVDREQGGLMLQTARGVLSLQGPPEALRDVQIGDVVRVRVALVEDQDSPPGRERF